LCHLYREDSCDNVQYVFRAPKWCGGVSGIVSCAAPRREEVDLCVVSQPETGRTMPTAVSNRLSGRFPARSTLDLPAKAP